MTKLKNGDPPLELELNLPLMQLYIRRSCYCVGFIQHL